MSIVKFKIAELRFYIELPKKVEISKEFLPFIETQGKPDCIVRFREKRQIEWPEGRAVKRNVGFHVLALPDGGWVRCYMDSGEEGCFLSTSRTLGDGSVLVEYLPEAKKHLGNIDRVFFHIAMEEQLLCHGRWIVHASCVKTPLGVILFVGPSGIGKTTQAELWEKYRDAKVLNGDRTILYQKKGEWYAAGSPYAGSSKRYVNESAPVCGVVLLEQGTENRVRLLSPGKAFQGIYPHLTVNDWNPWYVETIVDQLELFTRERPVFHFSCTPDERAVETLWQELTEEVRHGN